MPGFDNFSKHYTKRFNDALDLIFDGRKELTNTDLRLEEAMAYSLFNGGKRIRPLLAFASAEAIAEPNQLTDLVSAAIECIHTYSLIHDDLPAMDDDDLRRGKPSCHIAFDEATAILAGDALQALAFELISTPTKTSNTADQLAMCHLLAKASGASGMVAGQSIDLAAVDNRLNLEQLSHMHRLKTGALIETSVVLGALSTGRANEKQLKDLKHYAQAIGLAFQIQDDILDVTSDTTVLGKQQGSDAAQNKPTFVSLMGIKEAQSKTLSLFNDALNALSGFDYRADNLRHLAAYIIKRDH